MHKLVSSKGLRRALVLVSCVVLGGSLPGCVSKSKYQRALSANQACQQRVAEQEQRLGQLHASLVDLHMAATGNAADPNMSDEEIVAVLRTGYSDRDAQLSQFRGAQENALTYQLLAKYLFPSGSAQLTPQGRDALGKVATWLTESEANNIFVQGFTDDVPIGPNLKRKYASNWELSAHRATSVVRYLVDQGVPEERLIAVGYGEAHPEAEGMDETARQQNRRIEIKLNNGEFKEVVATLPTTVPQTALIDINRASVNELIVLPGVTPEFARSVVDYRARAGRINSFDELNQVRGYDSEKMQSLRTMVTFGGDRASGQGTIQDQGIRDDMNRSDTSRTLEPDTGTGSDLQRSGTTNDLQPAGTTTDPQRSGTGIDSTNRMQDQTTPSGTVNPNQERSDTKSDIYLVPKDETGSSGSPKNTYPDRAKSDDNSGDEGTDTTNPY